MRASRPILLIAAVLAAGCIRYGYHQRPDAGDAKRDASTDDAGSLPDAGSGGAGGQAGKPADGGARDAAAGSGDDAGQDEPDDAGETQPPTDAAAADSGTDAGEDLCPERPGMLFCDSFEDPKLARWDYTVSHNGSVMRSKVRAKKGPTSLLAQTGIPAPLSEARYATEVLAHQKSGDAWMRFYNWVPKSVSVTQHFSVGVMSETPRPWDGFELRILPSLVDLNTSRGVFKGTLDFPRDEWVCVEMHVFIDPIAGIYEAYLNGNLAARSMPVNTVPADGFTAAEIGIHYAGAMQGPVEVYVDDVVVATSRIPCD